MKKKILRSMRVRMYRQGLGDCFLLTFTNNEQKKHHMLIDCGVLPLSSGATGRLDLIAQDILAETGQHLDVVVATHEHADHISGFKSASEFFGLNPETKPAKPVQVDKVWLAWTENKDDEQVKKILQDCIESENKSNPLTDEQLVDVLKEKSYNIARRTIAKYREQLSIPVARLRKEL